MKQPIKVCLTLDYGYRWKANLYHRGASVLNKPVNHYASVASWCSREEAERELPELLGAPIEVVSVYSVITGQDLPI